MSDMTAAIAIVPFLVLLTLVLECSRIGCTWLRTRNRDLRSQRESESPQPELVRGYGKGAGQGSAT